MNDMDESSKTQLPLFSFDESNIESTTSPKSGEAVDSPFGKYIVYVDESGDHGLQSIDENYPIFVLAFCVFHKRYYCEAIVPALEKFKFNHFGHDQIVLHETDIRKERGDFNIFRSREEKTTFLDELTQIIQHSNFILISCIIDKRELSSRGDAGGNPYHMALGVCVEKLYEFLCEKNQHEKKTHVVVECRGKKEDGELELEFRRICDGNNRLGRKMPLEVIFSDKKVMSTGLQLADLVARPIGLSYLRRDQVNRAFEVLKEKFYCDGGRNCAGEGYEGRGLVIIRS